MSWTFKLSYFIEIDMKKKNILANHIHIGLGFYGEV